MLCRPTSSPAYYATIERARPQQSVPSPSGCSVVCGGLLPALFKRRIQRQIGIVGSGEAALSSILSLFGPKDASPSLAAPFCSHSRSNSLDATADGPALSSSPSRCRRGTRTTLPPAARPPGDVVIGLVNTPLCPVQPSTGRMAARQCVFSTQLDVLVCCASTSFAAGHAGSSQDGRATRVSIGHARRPAHVGGRRGGVRVGA